MSKFNIGFLLVNIVLLLYSGMIYYEYNQLKKDAAYTHHSNLKRLYLNISELNDHLNTEEEISDGRYSYLNGSILESYYAYLGSSFLTGFNEEEEFQKINDLFNNLWRYIRQDLTNKSPTELEEISSEVNKITEHFSRYVE